MNKFKELGAKLLQARKDKDEVAKNLYAYLIGQATLKTKEPSDTVIFDLLKSYVKSVTPNLTNVGISAESKAITAQEIVLINDILPKQLTTEEINSDLEKLKTEGKFDNYKLVVDHFSTNYQGQYNPGDLRAAWTALK